MSPSCGARPPPPPSAPHYTPGVSLHGSWCKAPLINLPKLVCVCVHARVCVPPCLNIYCRQGDRSPQKQASQALGWSVSDAWRKECKKELQRKERKWEMKHEGRKRKYTKQELRKIFDSVRAPDFTFSLVAYLLLLFLLFFCPARLCLLTNIYT